MIDYHDFWLRIERRGDAFWVTVRSPAGECEGPMQLPAGADAYNLSALVHAARGVRGDGGGAERDLAFTDVPPDPDRAGGELFRALFNEGIRDALSQSQGMVGKEGGLRFRLQVDLDDPQLARLAGLPWELLYDERTRTAFGRSPYTPIVRYVEVLRPYDPPPFEPPLRVLIALANPTGTHPLDLGKERAAIEATWARLEGVEVEIIEHATREKLFDALDAGVFHVLHYMGHGGFDERTGRGVLFLENATGEADPLLGETLGDTLRDERSMRLVVLNACDTGKASHSGDLDPFAGVAAALVMAGIPAVVAMQVPVADAAAVAFAEKFYADLATGRPVDASVAAGRKAIYRANPESLEWATPVLFMRAPDGRLFDTKAPAPEAPPPEPRPAPAPEPKAEFIPPTPLVSQPSKGISGSAGILRSKRGCTVTASVALMCLALFVVFNNVRDDEAGTPALGAAPPGAEELPGEEEPPGAEYRQGVEDDLAARAQQMEADGYEVVYHNLFVLRQGMDQQEQVRLEPGSEYVFYAACDGDCLQVTLGVYADPASDTALGEQRSANPFVVLVAPPDGATYTAEVYLEDCDAASCYVGLGVYSRPVEEP